MAKPNESIENQFIALAPDREQEQREAGSNVNQQDPGSREAQVNDSKNEASGEADARDQVRQGGKEEGEKFIPLKKDDTLGIP
jgi:hypothetical protein